MKTNYLFLADGFEIAEAMCPVDMMTRAGLDTKTVSITSDSLVRSSHGIGVEADLGWDGFLAELSTQEIDGSGILAFPGGMPGSRNLAAKTELIRIAQRHFDRGGITGAICAAPSVVLGQLQGIRDRRMCCYEGFEGALEKAGAIVGKEDGVVVDGNLVTSRGAGFAVEFGLALVSAALGQEAADKVARSIML